MSNEVKLFNGKMQPMIILVPGAMSPEDQQRLRDNGICVVESKEPLGIKFLDPIPSMVDRSKVEDAAIQLSRKILAQGGMYGYSRLTESGTSNPVLSRADICRMFVDLLTSGTPLDPNPTVQEQEHDLFREAKNNELKRLAREEAKAERDAAKKEAAELAAKKKAEAAAKKVPT